MFDLSRLDSATLSEQGAAMPILHPKTANPMLGTDGEAVTITLLGPNCNKTKAALRVLQTVRSEKQARGVKLTDEDFDRERFDLLIQVTTGWTITTLAGEPFPFSADNVKKLWGDPRWGWLSSQAFSYVQQDGNFLPSS